MITIFNRKEVCITHDLRRQGQVREALAAAGIPYRVDTRPLSGTHGRRSGTFGMNPDFLYQYRIFVHKKDHVRALHLIKK